MLPVPEFRDKDLEVTYDFLRSKLDDSGMKGVVLGLSGGLDSSVVAALAANALGKEKVHALHLPDKVTPEADVKDAEDLAGSLGIAYEKIDIDPLVEEAMELIGEFAEEEEKALANLKARLRMVLVYYYANTNDLLVLGTSNKSELMLGYFTKYGDGASDVAPIGDLYKSQVRALATTLGLPEPLIEKPPSAALLPGQCDEKDLGCDYDSMDRILYALERGVKVENIAKEMNMERSYIKGTKARVESNRHKRKMPKIPKLGITTIGTDVRE